MTHDDDVQEARAPKHYGQYDNHGGFSEYFQGFRQMELRSGRLPTQYAISSLRSKEPKQNLIDENKPDISPEGKGAPNTEAVVNEITIGNEPSREKARILKAGKQRPFKKATNATPRKPKKQPVKRKRTGGKKRSKVGAGDVPTDPQPKGGEKLAPSY